MFRRWGAGTPGFVHRSRPPEMAMAKTRALAQAPGFRAELRQLPDDELLRRFHSSAPDSDQRTAACEILVQRHEKLVRSCVRQYRGSPEPTEDLMQVGYVGLLKAINNYNPE